MGLLRDGKNFVFRELGLEDEQLTLLKARISPWGSEGLEVYLRPVV